MRIDKKYFPILFEFYKSRKYQISKIEKQFINSDFNHDTLVLVNTIINESMGNICYLNKSIVEAFDYCSKKTITQLLNLRNDIDVNGRCVLMHNSSDFYECVFYCFNKREDRTNFLIMQFPCHRSSNKMFMDNPYKLSTFIAGMYMHSWENKSQFGVSKSSFINTPVWSLENKTREEYLVSMVELFVQCEVFLQYAELKEKKLAPHARQMDGVKCIYENKLPFNINIIDSTWFTTLVKSDEFKVRGHFRLQPYGHEMKQKKLIWINEFKKEGYTREAKILSEYPATAGTL